MDALAQYEGNCIGTMYDFFANEEEAQYELEKAFDSYCEGSSWDYIEEETPILAMIEEAEKRNLIEPFKGDKPEIIIKKVKPENDFPDDLS